MKFISFLHIALIILFATLNGIMLYMFLLPVPYGVDYFLHTLATWDDWGSRIVIVATLAAVLSVVGAILAQKLPSHWKNRLLYLRWSFPHPSQDAFLASRKQPFESQDLLAAYPVVKDSGFNRQVQVDTWHSIHDRVATIPVVVNTRLHWEMLRDIYVLSLFYIVAFALGWVVNYGVPFQVVAAYLFLFGAQFLFLWMTGRKMGVRLVDNVLGVSLGVEEFKQEPLGKIKKKKKK